MDSHARPALAHLPLELLQEILGLIHPDTVSIFSLASTCGRLHEVAVPFLYRTVVLRNHQGSSFAAVLEHNPSYADYVQSLTIHYHYVPGTEETTYYPLYAEALSPMFGRLNQLRKLTIKGCEYNADREGHDPIFGGLDRMLAETEKFHNLFLRSLDEPILTNLTTCELNLSDGEPWELSEREAIFLHPHLRRLTILGGRMADFQLFQENHRHTTALEELSLLCCDIGPHTLHHVLAVPNALLRFTFKGAARTLNPSHLTDDHPAYLAAIAQQAHSLLSLDIDFAHSLLSWDVRFPPPPNIDIPRLDLRPFTVLQDLTMQPTLLTGAENGIFLSQGSYLPVSLRNLAIRDYRESIRGPTISQCIKFLVKWFGAGSLPELVMIELVSDRAGIIWSNWTKAFGGKVRVETRGLVTEGRFPLDCDCCKYKLGTAH